MPATKITLWPHYRASQGHSRTVEWSHFRRERHKPLASKEDAPLWSPTIYRADPPRRGNRHVVSITMAVYDLDDLDAFAHVRLFQRMTQFAGAAWWLYSTYSHTPKTPKYRLVIPLARPIPTAQWGDAWHAIKAHWIPDIPADERCTDPARIYYAPSAPPQSISHAVSYGH